MTDGRHLIPVPVDLTGDGHNPPDLAAWARDEVGRLAAIERGDERWSMAQDALAYWRGYLSKVEASDDPGS